MKKYILLLSCLFIAACANTSSGNPTTTTSSSTPQENTETTEQVVNPVNPEIEKYAADRQAVTTTAEAYFPQLSQTAAEDEAEVKVITTKGEMIIRLFPKFAPLSVENFLTQVKEGQYDGITIGPIGQNYILQSNYSKKVNSIWKDVNTQIDPGTGFTAEISPYLYNIRGAVSMVSGGPNTANSVFFINTNNTDSSATLSPDNLHTKIIEAYKNGGNPGLDGYYGVFGQVTTGFSVLDAISATLTADNQLLETVTITRIEVLKDYTF